VDFPEQSDYAALMASWSWSVMPRYRPHLNAARSVQRASGNSARPLLTAMANCYGPVGH
jgi:hypothetical protein